MERIDEIKARERAATPGPWRKSRTDIDSFAINPDEPKEGHQHVAYVYYPDEYVPVFPRIPIFGDNARANADFISSAREDIPALLAAYAAEKERADKAEVSAKQWEDFAAVEQSNGLIRMLDHDDLKAKAIALTIALKSLRCPCDSCEFEHNCPYSGCEAPTYTAWKLAAKFFKEANPE